ncbi:DEKNAAC104389 [Brettanomyces naardenensis]|uniref:Protein YAE1 n=1 Tax=Brettanomyces naardenensis TaxID=13370 RepID=A0A448YQW1_BRENA|nr:DEKNAAC104389 [Brettanomyces naardenensis]
MDAEKTEQRNDASDNDDVWYSDGSENPATEIDPNETYGSIQDEPNNLSIASLKREHAKQGYLDGLTKARESSLQQGFDDGYPVGSRIGGLVGDLIAQSAVGLAKQCVTESQHKKTMEELNIRNVLQGKYFDSNLNLDNEKEHPVILAQTPTTTN